MVSSLYVQHATQLKPRQTNSYCATSDFKKFAKCLTVVHCFPYTSEYGMWMCLSTACTLTSSGEPRTKDRKYAYKLRFPRSQPQLPTPSLRPAHAPKQRSNPGWFAPWLANKAVTWTPQNTSTKSQNTRSLTLTAHWQMHARTHPTLLARHSHYGNERRTRRKMTVVVRPRGYTHMGKIDHFEGLFRQLWTRVFAPNKLIWKARNELNPFLQKNRCHLQTANKSNF